MPFLENGELRTWVANKGPSVTERKHVLHQVVEGLQFLHSNDVVHGDLNPDNVLVSLMV